MLLDGLAQRADDDLADAAVFALGDLIRTWRGSTTDGVRVLTALLTARRPGMVDRAMSELELDRFAAS